MGDVQLSAKGPVVLLCSDCAPSRIVFHRLRQEIGEIAVIEEAPVSRVQLLRRRVKKLGVVTVLGQVLFIAVVVPILTRRSAARIEEIKRDWHMDDSPMTGVSQVPSANSEAARTALRALDPSLVIVCGTRILSATTLRAVDCPIVNYHAGITPTYRGVHGGYWALADGRPDLVGSTIHLVDEGIDTGGVVEQATFAVTARDSFVTYPYLHLGAALPMIVAVARRVLAGEEVRVAPPDPSLPSRLRTHPTLWGYVRSALVSGVR